MTAVAYRNTECVDIWARLSAVDMTMRNNQGKSAMILPMKNLIKPVPKFLKNKNRIQRIFGLKYPNIAYN